MNNINFSNMTGSYSGQSIIQLIIMANDLLKIVPDRLKMTIDQG